MQFWPDRDTPSTTTCRPPRSDSIEPGPEDREPFLLDRGVGAMRALLRLTSQTRLSLASDVADERMRARTCVGVSDGRACRSSATAPETAAVACDVPLPRNSVPLTTAPE